MNILFYKLASDSVAVLAGFKICLPIKNMRSSAALDRTAVLNFRTVRRITYIFK